MKFLRQNNQNIKVVTSSLQSLRFELSEVEFHYLNNLERQWLSHSLNGDKEKFIEKFFNGDLNTKYLYQGKIEHPFEVDQDEDHFFITINICVIRNIDKKTTYDFSILEGILKFLNEKKSQPQNETPSLINEVRTFLLDLEKEEKAFKPLPCEPSIFGQAVVDFKKNIYAVLNKLEYNYCLLQEFEELSPEIKNSLINLRFRLNLLTMLIKTIDDDHLISLQKGRSIFIGGGRIQDSVTGLKNKREEILKLVNNDLNNILNDKSIIKEREKIKSIATDMKLGFTTLLSKPVLDNFSEVLRQAYNDTDTATEATPLIPPIINLPNLNLIETSIENDAIGYITQVINEIVEGLTTKSEDFFSFNMKKKASMISEALNKAIEKHRVTKFNSIDEFLDCKTNNEDNSIRQALNYNRLFVKREKTHSLQTVEEAARNYLTRSNQ